MDASQISLPELHVQRCQYIAAQRVCDGRDGCLNIITSGHELPFAFHRVYYIHAFEGACSVRGRHAHRVLEQALFCLSGSLTLGLDDGERKQSIRLSAGPIGIWLRPALWHTMSEFAADCVLMVLASGPYDESDYIRDYDEFQRFSDIRSI